MKKVRKSSNPAISLPKNLLVETYLHPEAQAVGRGVRRSPARFIKGLILQSCKYKFEFCISRSVSMRKSCGIVYRIILVG